MLLRQMKYFIAVVECNSFTEAAEQYYISQSAISQQIQSLEKELGVELIHREKRRFTLTNFVERPTRRRTGLLPKHLRVWRQLSVCRQSGRRTPPSGE